jgi:hypothetical protein
MSLPLASLQRHDATLHLLDPVGPPPLQGAAENAPELERAFRRHEDAEDFLRAWMRSLPGAMTAFRAALARFEPGSPLWSFSDDRVVRLLASRLHRGSIVALESAPAVARIAVASGSLPATSAADAAAAAAAFQPTPIAAPAAPDTPVLPILEEVQIEGAEVLPEVEATLAQLDASMATINLASVSLEPAPSGVPGISTSMTEASGSVTSTLDEL